LIKAYEDITGFLQFLDEKKIVQEEEGEKWVIF
jgi:hypothetical protein